MERFQETGVPQGGKGTFTIVGSYLDPWSYDKDPCLLATSKYKDCLKESSVIV